MSNDSTTGFLVAVCILSAPAYLLGYHQSPDTKSFREFEKAIERCEETIPRNQICKVDWSKAVIVASDKPTTHLGDAFRWLTKENE